MGGDQWRRAHLRTEQPAGASSTRGERQTPAGDEQPSCRRPRPVTQMHSSSSRARHARATARVRRARERRETFSRVAQSRCETATGPDVPACPVQNTWSHTHGCVQRPRVHVNVVCSKTVVCVCVWVFMCVHASLSVHVCACVCMCVCVCARACMCVVRKSLQLSVDRWILEHREQHGGKRSSDAPRVELLRSAELTAPVAKLQPEHLVTQGDAGADAHMPNLRVARVTSKV